MANAVLNLDYTEVITQGTKNIQLANTYTEVLVQGTPNDQLATQYVEVLVPALLKVFIGWGVPL